MKRTGANFDRNLKVGKIKIKVCNVDFFDTSFIKRSLDMILNLIEGTTCSFIKFKY